MKRNHFMAFAPQDWFSSPLRGELALERDHLSRMVYLELMPKLWEEGGAIRRADVSGACAITKAEADHAIARLLASGRLYETEDGLIRNPRIDHDLEALGEYRQSQSQNAKQRWVAKPNDAVAKPNDAVASIGNAGGVGIGEGKGEGEVLSVSVVEEVSNKGQTSLALFEEPIDAVEVPPVTVAPPTRARTVSDLARRFMLARALRLTGHPLPVSDGTLRAVEKLMDARLRDGFEPDLLVSLPVLVEDGTFADGRSVIDGMMKRDPVVLLRDDNKRTGTGCHARRYEGQMPDLLLPQRLVDILKAIGTWEWARTRIKVREGVC